MSNTACLPGEFLARMIFAVRNIGAIRETREVVCGMIIRDHYDEILRNLEVLRERMGIGIDEDSHRADDWRAMRDKVLREQSEQANQVSDESRMALLRQILTQIRVCSACDNAIVLRGELGELLVLATVAMEGDREQFERARQRSEEWEK